MTRSVTATATAMAAAPAGCAPLRLRPPQFDPPYDDERPGEGWAGEGWATQGALALRLAPPRRTTGRGQLRLVRAVPLRDERTGRDVTPHQLPPAGPRANQLVRAVLEVLSGTRPSRHLASVTAPLVLAEIESAISPARARPWSRTVRTLHLAEPGAGVAEVTAVVNQGSRCAALALRMEGLDGRWIVTEIALV